MLEWLFKKVKMGCSSGMVSSLTSMRGGWYVCTMDKGRDSLLCRREGLAEEGESATATGEWS